MSPKPLSWKGSGKEGGPAFPAPETELKHAWPGMLLRDYFAAKAMAALIGRMPVNSDGLPETAYAIADRMLAVRGKT